MQLSGLIFYKSDTGQYGTLYFTLYLGWPSAVVGTSHSLWWFQSSAANWFWTWYPTNLQIQINDINKYTNYKCTFLCYSITKGGLYRNMAGPLTVIAQ
jgi:hypothetical protein